MIKIGFPEQDTTQGYSATALVKTSNFDISRSYEFYVAHSKWGRLTFLIHYSYEGIDKIAACINPLIGTSLWEAEDIRAMKNELDDLLFEIMFREVPVRNLIALMVEIQTEAFEEGENARAAAMRGLLNIKEGLF